MKTTTTTTTDISLETNFFLPNKYIEKEKKKKEANEEVQMRSKDDANKNQRIKARVRRGGSQ